MVGTTERNERYPNEETQTASSRLIPGPRGPRERSLRPGTSRLQPGLRLRQALLHRRRPRDLRFKLAALPVTKTSGRPRGARVPLLRFPLLNIKNFGAAACCSPWAQARPNDEQEACRGSINQSGIDLALYKSDPNVGDERNERNSHEKTDTASPGLRPCLYRSPERSRSDSGRCPACLHPVLHPELSLLRSRQQPDLHSELGSLQVAG